jgi:hypothetical protein
MTANDPSVDIGPAEKLRIAERDRLGTCPSANAPELPAGFAVIIIAQCSALGRLSAARPSIPALQDDPPKCGRSAIRFDVANAAGN